MRVVCPPRSTFTSAVVLLLGSALLVTGCGGEDRLSKSEYIKENNKIQKRINDSTSQLSSGGSDPDALAKQFGIVRDDLQQASEDFEDLSPPAEWEDEHKVIIRSLEDTAKIMSRLQTAAKKQDTKALTATFAELNKIQARYQKAVNSINAD